MDSLLQSANRNHLTIQGKKNEIDNNITHIMLKVESNITTDKPHELWSPELHNALCIVSTLKVLLIQAIKKTSNRKQTKFY